MKKMLISGAMLSMLALTLAPETARGVDPRKAPRGTTTASNDPFAPAVLPGTSTSTTTTTPAQPATTTPPGATRDRLAPAPTPGDVAALIAPPSSGTSPDRPPRWRLGVYSQDTDIGVKILRVVAGSPAERAGLEKDDLIVAVAGYQVGIVNGVHYDCGYEFENRADAQGNVKLLVQDHRNKQLVNLPVKLDSRLEKVSGTISYRNRIFLPQNAVALIELREHRTTGPGIVLGDQRVEEIRQIPIPYEIEYDPLDINPRRTYVVHATISANGRTLYTTTDQYAVITNNRGQTAAVTVVQAPQNPAQTAEDQRAEIEAQIVQYFRDYMGREPRPDEMPVWTAQVLERGRTLADVQADLLSNPQVWHRCEHDEARFIQLMSESITGRQLTQDELDYWVWRLQQSGGLRRDLAADFLANKGVPR
ncbi:MAG: hypothetical protein DWQ34_01185 [Planctomycetota bacterium]|nr:MAG: hypothetical protein DWQ29_07485 [Planctomycetota bacterium]REJ97693.1 MAG: hypothetical protein DWQ34_01185 [Planctomycetota bacterium]REK26692.1 MAG: hypothetical protein DWQ41_09095 [Planctomycetota bacterium]REK35648.1 MAG: hypothetical protein DWQ45_10860 [Planctomycetota bacterium]